MNVIEFKVFQVGAMLDRITCVSLGAFPRGAALRGSCLDPESPVLTLGEIGRRNPQIQPDSTSDSPNFFLLKSSRMHEGSCRTLDWR